jgi:hypothetical protein
MIYIDRLVKMYLLLSVLLMGLVRLYELYAYRPFCTTHLAGF